MKRQRSTTFHVIIIGMLSRLEGMSLGVGHLPGPPTPTLAGSEPQLILPAHLRRPPRGSLQTLSGYFHKEDRAVLALSELYTEGLGVCQTLLDALI